MTDETSASGESQEWVTGTVGLNISGERFEMEITVPAAPTRPRRMLPIFQSLAESLVGIGVSRAEAEGGTISCKKGCGACCRQLVPLAEMEAHQIRDVLESLPEPRRSIVRARFEDGYARLEAAGLLEKLEHPERFSFDNMQAFGMEYFQQGIACPFLEDESCSIHPDRPTACREYLVTSPAEHCAQPSAETVRCVELPGKVSTALCRLTQDASKTFIPWVPLILAPRWANEHTDETTPRPGPEILRDVFERLTEKPTSKK
jgi:Fe-S-cluster containining protein